MLLIASPRQDFQYSSQGTKICRLVRAAKRSEADMLPTMSVTLMFEMASSIWGLGGCYGCCIIVLNSYMMCIIFIVRYASAASWHYIGDRETGLLALPDETS